MPDAITTTGASASAPPTPQALSNEGMGKEEFLRLLVTQLSNQDPLNPMDGQEFAAQLAQFTSVEQLVNINGTLEGQQEMYGLLSQNVNSGVAAGLLGRHVEASGNQVSWSGGDPIDLGFTLPDNAAEVTVTVKNSAGATVRTMTLDGYDKGSHTAEWDGRDDDGREVPEGSYTFSVDARDTAGGAVAATPYVGGHVDRVTFGEDGIQLWIGDTRLPMSAIRTVSQAGTE